MHEPNPFKTAPTTKDCPACESIGSMKLQNAASAFMLFYVCEKCGAWLAIPPPKSET